MRCADPRGRTLPRTSAPAGAPPPAHPSRRARASSAAKLSPSPRARSKISWLRAKLARAPTRRRGPAIRWEGGTARRRTPASRASARTSGGRPWTNSAPRSRGIPRSGSVRVSTRPPAQSRASSTRVETPARRRTRAAWRPAAPAPRTRTVGLGMNGNLPAVAARCPPSFRVHQAPQHLRHAPRLRDAAARRERRLGVEDLADRADAGRRPGAPRSPSRSRRAPARSSGWTLSQASTNGPISQPQTVPW